MNYRMKPDPPPLEYAYTGERYIGAANLCRLDGDHTGTPEAGALVLVRRHAGDNEPLRMLLVERVRRGDTYDGRHRDWPRPIWAVRPERPLR